MKQEFTTLYGKAIFDNNRIFIRTFDVPFSRTSFAVVAYQLLYLVIFVSQFFVYEPPRRYVGILLWGLLLAFHLPDLYLVLFKRSYANMIPVQHIRSFNIENDHRGLHTTVSLVLANGRERKILFRTLENQYQPFTELIEQHIAQPQLA